MSETGREKPMTLAQAAAEADELAMRGAERELAQMRSEWDEELEAAARNADFRERAVGLQGRRASSAFARSWSC